MAQDKLVQKQILLSVSNLQKLDAIAAEQDISVSGVVRKAIDAYDPEDLNMGSSDWMELISIRLKEAISDIQASHKRLDVTLGRLGE